MKSFSSFSLLPSARLFRRLTTVLTALMLVVTIGCAETDDPIDEPADAAVDAAFSPSLPGYDAGNPSLVDAGNFTPPWGVDSGTVLADASSPAPSDAGPAKSDAAAADAGFTFPDLGTLFPSSDAGPAPTPDAGTGARNVNGPCKDLNLLCFDFVDMWINAECATCNSGKGCQGCAIPFAY